MPDPAVQFNRSLSPKPQFTRPVFFHPCPPQLASYTASEFGDSTRMDTFYQVFGFVAAICIGIIVLTAFFTAIGYFKSKTRGFDILTLKGFIKDGKLINVYLSGGKSVLGVRFIGFTDQSAGKGGVPYQLSSMVILETTKGSRVLIRADSVRMIEEVDDVA
ncbi:MAG: hypothetical protein H7Y43_00550 [Akkermansiaceae bacterium]|nr:hypothetical protein [Verrucomicrobiales bacterium]